MMMNYHERIFCLCKLSGYRPSPTSPKYFNKAASKANNIISRQLHISFCYKPSLTLISIHPACALLFTHLSYAASTAVDSLCSNSLPLLLTRILHSHDLSASVDFPLFSKACLHLSRLSVAWSLLSL